MTQTPALYAVTPQSLEELHAEMRRIEQAIAERRDAPHRLSTQQLKVQSIATEVILKRRPQSDLESAQNDLELLVKQSNELPGLRASLELVTVQMRRQQDSQRQYQIDQVKRQHAEQFAYYANDCRRLLEQFRSLLALEREYHAVAGGAPLPTPNWNSHHQRMLNLPAINIDGQVGNTAEFL